MLINIFTLADGYSRHVEFAQNAQPQFSSLYWKELINILWMCIYVFKKYICTIKSIDAYRRPAAFGPYEVWIAHDVYCRHEEMKHKLIPFWYWKELSNILWTCVHVSNVLKVYTGTIKSDNWHLRQYQSYISNWYINGKVFTSTTAWKPKSSSSSRNDR